MRFVCLLLLFSLSCDEGEIRKDTKVLNDATIEIIFGESDIFIDSPPSLIDKSKWICHHPESVFHNQECVEESYPNGCYVEGDYHKFCWLLYKDDCDDPLNDNILESCKNVGYL